MLSNLADALYSLTQIAGIITTFDLGSKYEYRGPQAVKSLEILLTHLAHASTLRDKTQFCTWFITFVSATYKGEAHKAAMRLLCELKEMAFGDGLDLQAGDAERDIEGECLEFMKRYPDGALHLQAGHDLDVQATAEEVPA